MKLYETRKNLSKEQLNVGEVADMIAEIYGRKITVCVHDGVNYFISSSVEKLLVCTDLHNKMVKTVLISFAENLIGRKATFIEIKVSR